MNRRYTYFLVVLAVLAAGCTKTVRYVPFVDEDLPSGRCHVKTTDGRSYDTDDLAMADSMITFHAVYPADEMTRHDSVGAVGLIQIPVEEVSSIEQDHLDLLTPLVWMGGAVIGYITLAILAIR